MKRANFDGRRLARQIRAACYWAERRKYSEPSSRNHQIAERELWAVWKKLPAETQDALRKKGAVDISRRFIERMLEAA